MGNSCLNTRNDADEFVKELCTFIDEFYLGLVVDYDCCKDEVWILVNQLVTYVFMDLNKVRVAAREVHNSDNPEQMATLIFWMHCVHIEFNKTLSLTSLDTIPV